MQLMGIILYHTRQHWALDACAFYLKYCSQEFPQKMGTGEGTWTLTH